MPGRKRKDELSRARLSILRFHLPNRYLEAGEMNKIDNHVIYSPRLSERVYDRSIFVAGKFNWAKGRELPKSVSVWIDQVCVGETQVFAEKNFPEGQLDTKSLGKMPQPINELREALLSHGFVSIKEKRKKNWVK